MSEEKTMPTMIDEPAVNEDKSKEDKDPADYIESNGRKVYCPGMKMFLDRFLLAWSDLNKNRVLRKATLDLKSVNAIFKIIQTEHSIDMPQWNKCPAPGTLTAIVRFYLHNGGVERACLGAFARIKYLFKLGVNSKTVAV